MERAHAGPPIDLRLGLLVQLRRLINGVANIGDATAGRFALVGGMNVVRLVRLVVLANMHALLMDRSTIAGSLPTAASCPVHQGLKILPPLGMPPTRLLRIVAGCS